MNYYNQPEFDNGNLVNTDSIEIRRNRYNMHVLLCHTHNDEYFEATVREDGYIFISKDADTIFQEEKRNVSTDRIPIYTIRATDDLTAWVQNNPLPDLSEECIELSKIRYIEDHPEHGKLSIECLVNDFDQVSFPVDPDKMEVVADHVIDRVPKAIIYDAITTGGADNVRPFFIDKEISSRLNHIVKIHPYHPADDMLSYRMAYETQYLNFDFSELMRCIVPVVVDGEKGRLVINRKDSLWEACLYIHPEKWAKVAQDETQRNGGFAHMNDDEFLMRVITVFGFTKGIFIELDDTPLAA